MIHGGQISLANRFGLWRGIDALWDIPGNNPAKPTPRNLGQLGGPSGSGSRRGRSLGLGSGALMGDGLQAVEKKQTDLAEQIRTNELVLQRQRQETEKLKAQSKER